MAIGYFCSRYRRIHIFIMLSVLCIDVWMPFYLYQTGDWYKRLLVQEEIFSFLIWMHFGLILCLYLLFAVQIHTAFQMIRHKKNDVREMHRQQGRAALLVKFLIVLTGIILIK